MIFFNFLAWKFFFGFYGFWRLELIEEHFKKVRTAAYSPIYQIKTDRKGERFRGRKVEHWTGGRNLKFSSAGEQTANQRSHFSGPRKKISQRMTPTKSLKWSQKVTKFTEE